MWTRKDAAGVLLAAVLFLTIGLLLFPPPASPATKPTTAAITQYMRGWIDGAAPPGVYVKTITCSPISSSGFRCVAHINDGSCATAIVHSYAFAGPVNRCHTKQSGPGA